MLHTKVITHIELPVIKFSRGMIDETLKLDVYKNTVCIKVLKSVNVMGRVFNMVPFKAIHSVIYVILYSPIEFVICACKFVSSTSLKRLNFLSKNSIR